MSLFVCPVCAGALVRGEREYRCPAGHSYDIAREGYVHLLPANRKHSKSPGDDREMVAARSRFLDGGWYEPLREALCALALRALPRGGAVLDAGCGEGYYTEGVVRAFQGAGRPLEAAGVDLSKFALKRAARRVREAAFAVASVYRLPLAAETADLVIDCFSPLAAEEYRRVLRPGGTFLYVVPGGDHLMEMKRVLYDEVYENPEERTLYEGFSYVDVTPVRSRFTLPDSKSIMDLFGMTPYAWKTPRAGVERLRAAASLTVTASFAIHAFRRL